MGPSCPGGLRGRVRPLESQGRHRGRGPGSRRPPGPDRAVAVQNQPGRVAVLHNRPDGTFEPWSTVMVGSLPIKLIAADFNGDGFADLAMLHNRNTEALVASAPYLTVLYNDGTGHFPTRKEYFDPQMSPDYTLTAADFDGDGRLDLVMGSSTIRGVQMLLNHGDGTFEPPVAYSVFGATLERQSPRRVRRGL